MSGPNQENPNESIDRRVAALFERAQFWTDLDRTKHRILAAVESDAGAQNGRGGTWQRIYSLLFLKTAAAPALVLAAVLVPLTVYLFMPVPSCGKLEEGTLSLFQPLGQRWVAAQRGSVPSGCLLRAENSPASIALRDGSRITLQPLTYAEIAGSQLTLHKGAILADVKPQPPGHEFRVKTPTATITVIGTRFSVSLE